LPGSADIVKPRPLVLGGCCTNAVGFDLRGRPKCSIDGGTANAQGLCDLRRSFAARLQLAHLCGIDRRWTPFVYARGLRSSDPFQLAFSSQIRFELGEYPEHVEKCFTCCRRCIYGLFCCFEARSLGPDGSNQGLPKGLGRDGLYMLPCSITNSRCSL
jgi:hypothetical protein